LAEKRRSDIRRDAVTGPATAVGDTPGGRDLWRATPSDAFAAEPGAKLGRFVVLGLRGEGGMGQVFTALDPLLDRRVALKVLREEPELAALGIATSGRLLAEARAAAKIRHPNVITVHDVGTFGDRVFLAMDLVEGVDLAQWLEGPKDGERSTKEILAVFTQAGRGLAAAHASGVVHRDFKPDNVLVGDDGRVLVTDFGIAVATGSATSEPRGVVLGTPRYMAPEQREGTPADARSDQFAFAVALGEALDGRASPDWVKRIVARGSALAPADRYPSMTELLDDLERAPRRRRIAAWCVAGVAAAALSVVGWRAATRATVCRDVGRSDLAMWGDPSKAAVRAAFLGKGGPLGEPVLASTTKLLDAYVGALAHGRKDACEAARVRRDQSEHQLERRTECLDGRTRELRAYLAQARVADDDFVQNATVAAARLPSVEACADLSYVDSRTQVPDDPALRARVTELRERLADAHALFGAAKYDDGRKLSSSLVSDAEKSGFKPVLAEALLIDGQMLMNGGDPKEAATVLGRAVDVAEASRSDDVAAAAWITLVAVHAAGTGNKDDGDRAAARAGAALERMGGDPSLEVELLTNEGEAARNAGEPLRAVELEKKALEGPARLLDDRNPDVAEAWNLLGRAQREAGTYDAAIASFKSALRLREALLGPQHPDVADTLNGMGVTYAQSGDYGEAARCYERAFEIRQRAFGPDHPAIAISLNNLASALRRNGEFDRALPLSERALAINRKVFGEDHPNTADNLETLGLIEEARGDDDRAISYYGEATKTRERIYPPTHPSLAMGLRNLGHAALWKGDVGGAEQAYVRAATINEVHPGPGSPEVAVCNVGLGRVALARGKVASAVPLLEGAAAVLLARKLPADRQGDARFWLGQALWAQASDRVRARSLVVAALEDYRKLPGLRREQKAAETWLAAHPPDGGAN
jgi:tetratricopeptide (TPR) repeat protein